MICRVWRGWTTLDNAAPYQALLTGQVMPGLLAHQALKREIIGEDCAPEIEHMTLIWFNTLENVKAFVGDDHAIAHIPDAAKALLKRWDERVAHFDVFDDSD